MISNWEEAKLRSTYHFNKWHQDTDCVEHLGRFTGGWQTELQSVMEDAKPLTWANRRIASCLLYTSDADHDLLSVDLGCRRIIKKK